MESGSSRGVIEMSPASLEVENEIENLLIGKLNSVEMSEFRTLMEKFALLTFDEGKERGIETVRESPGDYIEKGRNEGRD
jgi:hypothetical protein